MKIAAIMTVLVLGLAVPSAALAHRPAHNAEKTAMVYHASGRYYGGESVDEPHTTPLRCFTADIATVAGGARWGAWTFSRYADQPAHAIQCHTGNGDAIEHKIGSRWYVLWEGSEGYPPTHNTQEGSLHLRGVPRRVAKDLLAGLS